MIETAHAEADSAAFCALCDSDLAGREVVRDGARYPDDVFCDRMCWRILRRVHETTGGADDSTREALVRELAERAYFDEAEEVAFGDDADLVGLARGKGDEVEALAAKLVDEIASAM